MLHVKKILCRPLLDLDPLVIHLRSPSCLDVSYKGSVSYGWSATRVASVLVYDIEVQFKRERRSSILRVPTSKLPWVCSRGSTG